MENNPKAVDSFSYIEQNFENDLPDPNVPESPENLDLKIEISTTIAKFISDEIREAVKEHLSDNLGNYRNEWLTTEEVLELLRVSRRTLQKYRNRGELAYYKKGQKILYHRTEIDRFMEEHTVRKKNQERSL